MIGLVFIAGFWLRGSGVAGGEASGGSVLWNVLPPSAKEKMYEAVRDGVRDALIAVAGELNFSSLNGSLEKNAYDPLLTDGDRESVPYDKNRPHAERSYEDITEDIAGMSVDHLVHAEEPMPQTDGTSSDVLHHEPGDNESMVSVLETISQTMTPKEKETFLVWAKKHLTADDLIVLNDLFAQGVTTEALTRAYQKMQGKWSDEDFAYLFSLFARYEAARAIEHRDGEEQTMPVFGSQPAKEQKKEQ